MDQNSPRPKIKQRIVIGSVVSVVALFGLGALVSNADSSSPTQSVAKVKGEQIDRTTTTFETTTTEETTTLATTIPTTLAPAPTARRVVATTRPVVRTSPPATAAPAPQQSSGCNPNYSPCVPNDPVDVDCAGGSGNGPSYVSGPVQVIGTDVYGLDANHDGIGCE